VCDLPHPSNSFARRFDVVCSFPSPNDIGSPIFSFPAKIVRRAGNLTSADGPPSCDNLMTPGCLQQLYGIPTESASSSSNGLAVSPFHQGSANRADLRVCAKASNCVPKIKQLSFQKFLPTFRTDLPPSTFSDRSISGGSNSQDPNKAGIEAVSTVTFYQHQITKTDVVLKNLDVQYTIGIASGVPTDFISVGNLRDSERLRDLINFLLGQGRPPQVLTTSYVWDENTASNAFAKYSSSSLESPCLANPVYSTTCAIASWLSAPEV